MLKPFFDEFFSIKKVRQQTDYINENSDEHRKLHPANFSAIRYLIISILTRALLSLSKGTLTLHTLCLTDRTFSSANLRSSSKLFNFSWADDISASAFTRASSRDWIRSRSWKKMERAMKSDVNKNQIQQNRMSEYFSVTCTLSIANMFDIVHFCRQYLFRKNNGKLWCIPYNTKRKSSTWHSV